MTLSALIRKRATGGLATAIPAIPATHGPKSAATVARIATVAVANPTGSNPDTAAHWRWLVHFGGRSMEVRIVDGATLVEILACYPDATGAEPMADDAPVYAEANDSPNRKEV